MLTRRQFLAFSGLTAASLGAIPRWLLRASAAVPASRNILIVLFQRGAADGLNILPPFDDPIYRRSRPGIGIEPPLRSSKTIDLDGRFGLHPSLAALLPLWRQRRFAGVLAAGSPDPSRSHFEAQNFMESGTPGTSTTPDGWLNRALTEADVGKGPIAALALAPSLPKTVKGRFPVTVSNSTEDLRGEGPMFGTFEALYEQAADAVLTGPVRDVGEARRSLAKGLPKFDPFDFEKAGYPKGKDSLGLDQHVSLDLYELARLIRADIGFRVGFVEMGGWDHHYNEGSTDGQLAKRLDQFGGSIAAFFRQLGNKAEDVVLVTMTEFGRTIEENGTGGTDHGHASLMMLFGGPVRGGKLYGRWPGLEKENLFEGRDLQVTTDYRQVMSEVLIKHLGVRDLASVFPGGPFASLGILG